jgi:hypothetical protein
MRSDDRLREAIHETAKQEWIASSLALLAMTMKDWTMKDWQKFTPPPPRR